MKKSLLLLIFIPVLSFSQAREKEIARDVCSNLIKVNFSDDINIINQKAGEFIKNTYQNNQSNIRKLTTEYKEKFPKLSEIEISRRIGINVTIELMSNCESYQRITMFKGNPVPEISKLTTSIGEKFNKIFLEKSKSQNIDNALIDTCIYEVSELYSEQLEKRFGEKYSSEFTAELLAYLMTKSKPYIEWTAGLIK